LSMYKRIILKEILYECDYWIRSAQVRNKYWYIIIMMTSIWTL
jgi:hypothetical protein